MTARILIVDDDRHLAEGLAYNLDRAGYRTTVCFDGPTGLRAVENDAHDLVLLDLMLPGIGGMEVLSRMRRAGIDCPVIILSAIEDETEKVRGFDLGAVDYVTKPFGVAELLARIRVRLDAAATESLVFAAGTARLDQFVFETANTEVALTPTEVDILRVLASRRGEVVAREELTQKIWGLGARSTRTLDTHVARLRKKVEADPAHPRNLVTVHGIGYRLVM